MKLVEGEEKTLEGVITKSRYFKGNYTNTFTDGKDEVALLYSFALEPGSPVKITGKVENHYGLFKIKVSSVENLPKEKYDEIKEIAETSAPVKEIQFLINNEFMKSLKDKINSFAKKLYSAQKLNRQTIVRFHNDGDGICGALALTFFLKASFTQQNSAIYSVRDAMRDLNTLTNSNNPLLILVDFGSNEESKDALSLLKAAGIEILIIDHHPNFEKLKEYAYFINPWEVNSSEDASKHTAGYIASEISRVLGNDATNYAMIALASDKSDLLEVEEKDKDSGIVLNYAAAYSSYGNNLEFYSSLLSNPELFNSMLFQAKEKIEQLLSLSKNQLKKKQAGKFNIHYINLGTIVKKFEFPGIGKSATQIYEHLIPKEEPSILICYGPRTVVFRITASANEKGADATEIIAHLKKSMPDFIESGGGHVKAAALRVKEGFEKSLFIEIEEFLGSK